MTAPIMPVVTGVAGGEGHAEKRCEEREDCGFHIQKWAFLALVCQSSIAARRGR